MPYSFVADGFHTNFYLLTYLFSCRTVGLIGYFVITRLYFC